MGDIATGISPRLAQAAYAGMVNGRVVDLTYPIVEDAKVRVLTSKDPESLTVYRHSTAHLLAAAVTQLFPKVQCGIGPPTAHPVVVDRDPAVDARAGKAQAERARHRRLRPARIRRAV